MLSKEELYQIRTTLKEGRDQEVIKIVESNYPLTILEIEECFKKEPVIYYSPIPFMKPEETHCIFSYLKIKGFNVRESIYSAIDPKEKHFVIT